MAISEEKMQIVINNYFKSECSVDTSIRQAFEKGFRIGVKKGLTVRPDNQVHLCDSCKYYFPKCPSESDDVILGNGIGNDNICACNKYKPSPQLEITLESAIDYLHSIGWMQEHDRIMEESAQAERPKGKWTPHREKSREYIGTVLVNVEYDYWLCDTCGYRVENGQPMYNFCPHCGTRMKGEEDER